MIVFEIINCFEIIPNNIFQDCSKVNEPKAMSIKLL